MSQEHATPESATRPLRQRDTNRAPLRYEQTILLIEDDTEMRRLLERTLVRDGYHVVAVGDGDQALDWLGLCLFDGSLEHVPALIVSDIRLPHFSGLELLEGLLCAVPEIPVILITGFPSEETYVEAFELGAARVLAKPFELDALRFAVSTVLEARALAPPTRSERERGGGGWTKLPA
jgi:DNA-binding NtrC family response regulator